MKSRPARPVASQKPYAICPIASLDGDTLVADVVAQTDEAWLDQAGNFHSTDVDIVEALSHDWRRSCQRANEVVEVEVAARETSARE